MRNEVIKEWLATLYDDAIAEAKATIENERLWAKGSGSEMEASTHLQNIEIQEEYIEVLENLKNEIKN